MLRRIKKQIAYAAGATLVVLIFVLLVAVAVKDPAPIPLPTPTPLLYQLPQLEDVATIRQGNTLDVAARIRNQNPRAGVARYPVAFVQRSAAGQELLRSVTETYVLPGAVQYVTAVGLPLAVDFASVTVELPSDPLFTEIPVAVSLPSFSTFSRERTTQTNTGTPIEEQKGLVRNTGTLNWDRVEVTAIAMSSDQRVVGIGRTFVGELKAGEQREFTVQWPASATEPQTVLVLATTNIYAEDNILKVIGDPEQLR